MNDNKVLDMRLEDIPFLRLKPYFNRNIVTLHNRGIYTLGDFINMDLKSISDMVARRTFLRLIDILKYKYLCEDLVCAPLLQKVYPATYEEYLNVKEKFHYPYTTERSLRDTVLQIFRRDCSQLCLPFKEFKYKRLFFPTLKGLITSLSMREYLECEDIRDNYYNYLIDFYLEYIRANEDKKDDTLSLSESKILEPKKDGLAVASREPEILEIRKNNSETSSELETLKKQLVSLTSQRDDLDRQIKDVRKQILAMSEGENNARR